MPTRLVILRHGQTEWSETGQHTGTSDIPLTAVGREQALSVAPRLTHLNLVAAATSPLLRASETADLAGLENISTDHDLSEWDYGAYDGLTTAEIRTDRPGWEIFRDGVPNGESLAEVATRADRVVRWVSALDGDVIVVTHGHFARVLAARWLELAPEHGKIFALSPAALSVLGHKREVPVVIRWNDSSHTESDWCERSVLADT